MNQAIVLVSYGVFSVKAREKCLEPIAAEIRDAFYDYMVFEAYTSDKILKELKEEGAYVYSVAEVLDRLVNENYSRVIVLPTHLTTGRQYKEKILDVVESYKDKFKEIVVARPAMESDGANANPGLVYAVEQMEMGIKSDMESGETLVLVGHGVKPTNHLYEALQNAADEAKINVVIGVLTADDKPDFDDVVAQLNKRGAKKVYLTPLLLANGNHADNDLGEPNSESWMGRLTAAGFTVRVHPLGLGANQEFRGIYMQRLMEVVEKLDYGC